MTNVRIERIRQKLAAEGMDALLVKQPANVRYLSGFTAGDDASLLITASDAFIITDFRYYEQAQRESPAYQLVKLEKPLPATFADLVHQLGARRVAFEGDFVTYALYQELSSAEGINLVPTKGWIETLRAIKSSEELALIQRAVAISDAAIAALPELIRPGMTERQLALELEIHMRTHGAEAISFPIIAAGGPNGAMPHAVATDRPLMPGEPIVLDLGARVAGYGSDLTRTICLGQPDARFQEIYGLVLAAQEAAESAIRPGILGKEVDAIARQIIMDAGYGDAFGHGLGHGIGLWHDPPTLNPRSEDRLQPGMVFSVEPGIYLPGWGGVRIEDVVVVTDTGAKVLTAVSKSPVLPR